MDQQHLNRNDKKTIEFFPEVVLSKDILSIWPRRAEILDNIETTCFQLEKFGNDTKMFWFRFQNNIGTFVLSFLTLLAGGSAGAAPAIHQPPPLPPRLNPRYVLFKKWMSMRIRIRVVT
jgi:hypothetical protein